MILSARRFMAALCIGLLCCIAPAASADDLLHTLRTGHPRLLVLDDQIPRIQQLTQTDPLAAATLKRLQAEGEKMLTARTTEYKLTGPRLLFESRYALHVISTTAGLYRVTGDVRFADRARKELLAIAALKDWHPPHFLDVAEMTNAAAIGYDWIYSQLSPEDRKTIATAILEKGLQPGLAEYKNKKSWTFANHNWAQVCSGGLTMGALAIADEQPDTAEKILELNRKTITLPMSEFAPDGGWDEGPGYWVYATSYNVFYLAALETALNTDFGFMQQKGFAQTPDFHIALTGPTGKSFNFADASEHLEPAPQIFWLAEHFHRPDFAAWERANNASRLDIFHLLWFDPGPAPTDSAAPSLDNIFRRVNVATFRSSWTDSSAWFVGFKGGDNAANHSHLDLGSFVLDAQGHRWALLLGSDDYNLPGYFGKQRYTYYRLRTEGQNTLTIDGQNQDTKAKSLITAFYSQPNRASAIADLTAAYPGQAQSARRGICLLNRNQVLLQDELQLIKPADIVWNFHTQAKVEISGSAAILSQQNAKLKAKILSPPDAKFQTTSATPPPPQAQNLGITNLIIHVSATTNPIQITVLFSEENDPNIPNVEALTNWPQN